MLLQFFVLSSALAERNLGAYSMLMKVLLLSFSIITFRVHAEEIATGSDREPISTSSITMEDCDFMKVPSSCPSDNSCDPQESRTTDCAKGLFEICMADQKELESCHDAGGCGPDNIPLGYSNHISKRLSEVEKITNKKCLQNAADFSAAAVLYLHSDTTTFKPKSYLQAFQWARKAVELGDQCHRRYIAFGIRKYFDALKLKQSDFLLTHALLPDGYPCYSIRKGISGNSLEKQFAFDRVSSVNGKACEFKACTNDLTALPKNTIPGIW